MVKVLVGVATREDRDVLLDALPIAGVDGTLARRMTEAKYSGRIRAKTGYILGVCCLSGYVVDKNGKPAIAFSLMANDVPAGKAWVAKKLQDALCRALVDSLE
jgi:D-alanyl-D-alanine carboxypeptidase/D-alanyl-D-alanine-endopeptidase (penicillin-binding protein 4)